MQEQQTFKRRIFPLSSAQFLGMFNDNAFKTIALTIIFGQTTGAFTNTLFMLLLAVLFSVASVLFMIPAGFITDRLPKRYVMLSAKILEIICLLIALPVVRGADQNHFIPLLFILFCLCVQSVLFAPALYGVLPEVFHEREISHANGTVTFATLAGSAFGFGIVPVLSMGFGWSFSSLVWLLIASSALSFTCTLFVTQTISVVQKHRELAYPFGKTLSIGWKEMTRTQGLFLSVLGDAAFLSLGISVLTLLVFFCKFSLPVPLSGFDIPISHTAPLIGLAAGAYITGRMSKKIEMGLIPFGALGFGVFLVLAVYLPGPISFLTFSMPNSYFSTTLHLYSRSMLFMALAGFCGGSFLVPLRSFYQQRVHPEARGTA